MLRALRVLACLFAALPATAAVADTITLRADDWCPYTCAPNGGKPGYLIEVAREVFGKAGHTVNYEFLPWSRALLEVRNGDVAGAAGAGRGDLPEGVFHKVNLGRNANALALRDGFAFTYGGVASLEALRLGVVANYSYDSGELDAYIKLHGDTGTGRIEAVTGTEAQSSNIRKLLAGRIDAVLENESVLRLAISEMQPKPALRLVPVGNPDEIYIVFSPKNPKSQGYADLLDAGIAELRANGRLAAILTSYGLSDWQ